MSQEMPSRQLLQLALVEELGLLQDFLLQEAFILRLGSFGVDDFPKSLRDRAADVPVRVGRQQEITSNIHRGNGSFMNNFSMGIGLRQSLRRGLARLRDRPKLRRPIVFWFCPTDD